MGKLIVSLSPHAHGTDTVERNMYGVIIALMPATSSVWVQLSLRQRVWQPAYSSSGLSASIS